MAKLLISGGVSWTYELIIGHYFEFLKIAKQTNYHKSYAALTKEMVAKKGLMGVLDGYFPWGSIQAIAKGGVFGMAHAGAKVKLQPWVDNHTLSPFAASVTAGGIGGAFQGMVLSPTLLLKTRVMTDPIFRQDMTLAQTTKESFRVGMNVIRLEGVSALMKGSIVFSGKRVLDWSTRYMFSEIVEEVVFREEGKDVSQTQQVVASMMGGTISALFTIPIDVMVAQIQQASKAGQKVSVLSTLRENSKGGMGELVAFSTRGFVARVVHVALTTALMKTGASYVYQLYVGDEE